MQITVNSTNYFYTRNMCTNKPVHSVLSVELAPFNFQKYSISWFYVNIFWAVQPRYIQKMALAVSIFQKVLTFQCGRYSVFKKRASKVAHNRPRPFYFTVQPRPTAHSPELIFHIMKSWDQTSVLLSVNCLIVIMSLIYSGFYVT